jgi:hypothetical protein
LGEAEKGSEVNGIRAAFHHHGSCAAGGRAAEWMHAVAVAVPRRKRQRETVPKAKQPSAGRGSARTHTQSVALRTRDRTQG